jgi:phage/plasmid-like protein (TIGR03299 family)
MAHEIDTTTGKAAAFFAGQAAWHRLGTVVTDCQTSAAAIHLAGLNWSVEKWPMTATNNSITTNVPNAFAVVRTDTTAVLGTVGNWYRPFQNAEAFDFMDTIVGERLAMFETAGSLKGGRKVWMLARVPGELRIAGDDIVHPYVLLTNSHDGTSGLRILPTTVRVVCNNTLTLALRQGVSEGLTITHTESLERRISEARAKLGIITRRMDRFHQEAQALSKRSLSSNELREYFTGLVEARAEKQQKKLLESMFENLHNPRNSMPGITGTAWAAYNAVSEFADHQMKVTGNGAEALDNRVNSIWFGSANRMKQAAWECAMALVS